MRLALLILDKTFCMEYAVVTVPAAPVRRKARHQYEMVSQLLFGEMVEVLKFKKGKWAKIRSLHDNYQGWITSNMLEQADEKQTAATTEYITADIMNLVILNENKMSVPLASSLPGLTDGKGMIGNLVYQFSGNCINRQQQQPPAEKMVQLTNAWLNVPYMWGGRTMLGVDCSGFVQVNFKMIGIDLPRDAWQQAQEGKSVKKLKEAEAGDLAFFDDKEEIVHVGILLGPEKIIHASGKVRIDTIDKKGIIHSENGKRTHELKAIRRVW